MKSSHVRSAAAPKGGATDGPGISASEATMEFVVGPQVGEIISAGARATEAALGSSHDGAVVDSPGGDPVSAGTRATEAAMEVTADHSAALKKFSALNGASEAVHKDGFGKIGALAMVGALSKPRRPS